MQAEQADAIRSLRAKGNAPPKVGSLRNRLHVFNPKEGNFLPEELLRGAALSEMGKSSSSPSFIVKRLLEEDAVCSWALVEQNLLATGHNQNESIKFELQFLLRSRAVAELVFKQLSREQALSSLSSLKFFAESDMATPDQMERIKFICGRLYFPKEGADKMTSRFEFLKEELDPFFCKLGSGSKPPRVINHHLRDKNDPFETDSDQFEVLLDESGLESTKNLYKKPKGSFQISRMVSKVESISPEFGVPNSIDVHPFKKSWIAIGTSTGKILVFDADSKALSRNLLGTANGPVSSISWEPPAGRGIFVALSNRKLIKFVIDQKSRAFREIVRVEIDESVSWIKALLLDKLTFVVTQGFLSTSHHQVVSVRDAKTLQIVSQVDLSLQASHLDVTLTGGSSDRRLFCINHANRRIESWRFIRQQNEAIMLEKEDVDDDLECAMQGQGITALVAIPAPSACFVLRRADGCVFEVELNHGKWRVRCHLRDLCAAPSSDQEYLAMNHIAGRPVIFSASITSSGCEFRFSEGTEPNSESLAVDTKACSLQQLHNQMKICCVPNRLIRDIRVGFVGKNKPIALVAADWQMQGLELIAVSNSLLSINPSLGESASESPQKSITKTPMLRAIDLKTEERVRRRVQSFGVFPQRYLERERTTRLVAIAGCEDGSIFAWIIEAGKTLRVIASEIVETSTIRGAPTSSIFVENTTPLACMQIATTTVGNYAIAWCSSSLAPPLLVRSEETGLKVIPEAAASLPPSASCFAFRVEDNNDIAVSIPTSTSGSVIEVRRNLREVVAVLETTFSVTHLTFFSSILLGGTTSGKVVIWRADGAATRSDEQGDTPEGCGIIDPIEFLDQKTGPVCAQSVRQSSNGSEATVVWDIAVATFEISEKGPKQLFAWDVPAGISIVAAGFLEETSSNLPQRVILAMNNGDVTILEQSPREHRRHWTVRAVYGCANLFGGVGIGHVIPKASQYGDLFTFLVSTEGSAKLLQIQL